MKKGFTLVELLGVIVILGVIGVIVTPLTQNIILENNEKMCKMQITSFEKAAREYTNKNAFKLDCPSGNCDEIYNVSISDLQDEGFLDDGNIKNPVKGTNFDLNTTIAIGMSNKQFTFKYEDQNACQK